MKDITDKNFKSNNSEFMSNNSEVMRNKEKQQQIDEIAECVLGGTIEYRLQVAELIYNKGYRKQSEGEWVKINPNNLLIGEYYCSCCNDVIDIADGRETPLDREMYFCPNCGAYMRKEDEGK